MNHRNIAPVIGAVVDTPMPLVVSEKMEHGSLHDLLHNETIRVRARPRTAPGARRREPHSASFQRSRKTSPPSQA